MVYKTLLLRISWVIIAARLFRFRVDALADEPPLHLLLSRRFKSIRRHNWGGVQGYGKSRFRRKGIGRVIPRAGEREGIGDGAVDNEVWRDRRERPNGAAPLLVLLSFLMAPELGGGDPCPAMLLALSAGAAISGHGSSMETRGERDGGRSARR